MKLKKLTFKKREKRWTIAREKNRREAELKALAIDDTNYKITLDAVEKSTKIRNLNIDTLVNSAQKLGMLVLAVGVTVIAYSVDKSDSIPRNKFTMGLFNKIFKI